MRRRRNQRIIKVDVPFAGRSRRAPDFRPESCSPRQASQVLATTPIPEALPSLALRVPKGHKRDDLFYATVQSVYDTQAAISRRAAADIAVVVPSHDRPLRLRWLLNALADQTLDGVLLAMESVLLSCSCARSP